jgi:hypothetical protein
MTRTRLPLHLCSCLSLALLVGCPAADEGDDDGGNGPTSGTASADDDGTPTSGTPQTSGTPETSGGSTSGPSMDDSTSDPPMATTADGGTAESTAGDESGTTGGVTAVPCQEDGNGGVWVPDRELTAALPAPAPTDELDDFEGGVAGGGSGFIPTPDGGGNTFECDVFAQDCPEGEKCMPWANDGGSAWNATRCSPIAPDPGQPGDPCTVEGSGVSGIDDCDLGAMCWNVTPDGDGTCIEMCSGSPDAPQCDTSGTVCTVSNEGALAICQPLCNPLAQECDTGEGCYPIQGVVVCAPDASGDMGGAGDPCEYINACDDGLFCAGAAAVPGCAGSVGCCSPFCTVGDDSACLVGQTCTPMYPPGEAPLACVEDVGMCTG